jgi:DNA modification methylase
MTPWLQDPDITLYHGDNLDVLRTLPDKSVHMCATSPPFYGLRDYGTGSWEGGEPDCDHKAPPQGGPTTGPLAGTGHRERGKDVSYGQTCGKCGARRVDKQIGLEETPDAWVQNLVRVFREVRRVLRDDGTLWVEIGDSYAGGGGFSPDSPVNVKRREQIANGDMKDGVFGLGASQHERNIKGRVKPTPDIKAKDMIGQPWLLAFALRADGWYLRSEIIWARPNPMPESVTDRPTKSHSTVFLFAKGQWKSRVVALPDLHGEVVHVGNHVGSQNPSLWANEFGVRFATAILDRPEFKQQFALSSLDPKIWEQLASGRDSEAVGHLPVEHRAAVYATGCLTTNISPKEFLSKLDSLGVTLADGEKFRIGGGLTEIPLPPGVNRYGETAVAIHDSGEIGEVDWVAHTVKCSRPSRCSYFYDADAIREPFAPTLHNGAPNPRAKYPGGLYPNETTQERYDKPAEVRTFSPREPDERAGANARSVWTIPTQPTPFAHFATWPEALCRRMVLAGTSERGCCPECGAPWVRDTESTPDATHGSRQPREAVDQTGMVNGQSWNAHRTYAGTLNVTTVGWSPSCSHDHQPVPCTVLDPFAGSATTMLVARNHGRHSIGIELNSEYLKIAAKRLQQLSLLA